MFPPKQKPEFLGCKGAHQTQTPLLLLFAEGTGPLRDPTPLHIQLSELKGAQHRFQQPSSTGKRLEGKPGRDLAQRNATRAIKNKSNLLALGNVQP